MRPYKKQFEKWFEEYFCNQQGEDSPYSYNDVLEAFREGILSQTISPILIDVILNQIEHTYNQYVDSCGTDFFNSDDYKELKNRLIKNVRNK